MSSADQSQQPTETPYRRDEQGKFANPPPEPDAASAKPAAAPGSEKALPQFTSLLSHCGALPWRVCVAARASPLPMTASLCFHRNAREGQGQPAVATEGEEQPP